MDFYKGLFNPGVSPARLLTVNRIATAGAGVCGVLLAIVLPSVISAVAIFYGLLAVALFVPVVSGIYFRRTTWTTALASICVALLVTITVLQTTHGKGIGFVSPQLAGILAAAVVTAVMNLFTTAQDPLAGPAADTPLL